MAFSNCKWLGAFNYFLGRFVKSLFFSFIFSKIFCLVSYSIRPRSAGHNYYFLVHHSPQDQTVHVDNPVVDQQNSDSSSDDESEDGEEIEAPEGIEMQVFSVSD